MTSLIILFAFIIASLTTAASWPKWPPYGGFPPLPKWPPYQGPPFSGFPPSPKWPPFSGFPPLPKWPPYQGPPSPGFPGQPPPFRLPPDPVKNFYACVNSTSNARIKFSDGFYDPNYDKASFTAILNSTAENLRCTSQTIQKPKAIFTPSNDRQVQAAVQCAVGNMLNIRLRSGGHDYEGLSYISYTGQPFVVVDLRKLRNVDIDIEESTAWVDAGVTNGAVSYLISQKSKVHAFPAGLCPDLGIGGHITGGAYGPLMRKHGLGVDNVLDAEMVDAWGNILDRKAMGEDLFWAIRGGGGNNFGVILRLQIRLVAVPEKVTVFSIPQMAWQGNKNGMKTLQKWQRVSHTIADELFIRAIMVNAGPNAVLSIYQGVYLGNTNELLKVMKTSFPELGLMVKNCTEMSWIEWVILVAGFNRPVAPKDLLDGKPAFLNYFKAKSDFVKKNITNTGLDGMFRILSEGGTPALMIWTPYGGQMSRVAEKATAFPHRDAWFMIQYVAAWNEDSPKQQLDNEAWIRKLYDYMADYVTQHPREAYVNYRDLDIGKPDTGKNCSDPNIWGPKYYKGNYQRLVEVKTRVDPYDVFRTEQSIPSAYSYKPCGGCVPFDQKGSST